MISVSVGELLKDNEKELHLRLTEANEGLNKKITVPIIQKFGMALTGYTKSVRPNRLQILGNTEITYLKTLKRKEKEERINRVCATHGIAAFIVTNNHKVSKYFIQRAKSYKIPTIITSLNTTEFISHIRRYLEEKLSPATIIHGVLLEIFGIGTLILGKSGIGKSESALDLILRGHRLVADDIVKIKKRAPTVILGEGGELIKYHMEIRGLGIINIKDLFGSASVKEVQKIELIINLALWDSKKEYDRLGIDKETYSILGVKLPLLNIPVTPGRNMATIIEVACRNHILKQMGHDSAKNFHDKLLKKINGKKD
jgi:HPr kinase/phosphorylase